MGLDDFDYRDEETNEENEDVTTSVERKRAELAKRRETGEISQHDFDLGVISYIYSMDLPITHTDVVYEGEPHAIVLTSAQFSEIGILDYINASGQRTELDSDTLREGDILILYPEDLGGQEIDPSTKG